jgi:hypothetical protein
MTFTTQEKSSSGGTLTTLGTGSPQVTVVAADGTGTMTVSPTTALNSSSGNQLVFTYTAPAGGLSNGEITLLVPTGWTTPQTGTETGAGWVSAECGSTTTVSAMTIEVTGVTLSSGGTCTIIYGDTFEGPGATAPATSGPYTFTTKEESSATGTLTSIATSPVVNVNDDGTGTMTASPLSASAGAAGDTVTFTYTSAVALSSGELTVAIPAGWSAPSTSGTNPGFTTTTCSGGTVGVSGSTIQVTGITIAKGVACSITYGAKTSGGPGATVTSTVGASVFSVQEKSSSGDTLTALATSPSLTVFAPDGSGTLTVAPTSTASASGANTLKFTYTIAAGGLSGGQILVTVPSGWSMPSTTSGKEGYTTSTCGSVAISGSTIQVTGITRSAAETCTITYGNKSSGGAGAAAPSSGGTATFTTQEESTVGGSATNIASSPQVDVTSADGEGTMTVSPAAAVTGSSANTLTFAYTAASGGTNGGEITLNVPTGWSAPSTAGSAAGYTTASCGTVGVSATTIQVTGVTLPGDGTCTIVFGSTASGGPGASAPSSETTSAFATSEMSTAAGILTAISASPTVTTSPARTLTVAVSGSGTVTGGGISCPSTCSGSYTTGTAVSLTATPAPGFTFTGWSGACSGTGACELRMSADQAVTATFTATTATGTATANPHSGVLASKTSSGSTGPNCSLKPVSSKVKKGKRHGPDTLAVIVRCDQTVSVTLTGTVTEKLKGKHGKHKTKTKTKMFKFAAMHASLSAGKSKTLVLKLPSGAQKALSNKASESATFTLTAGTVRFTASIQSLKL